MLLHLFEKTEGVTTTRLQSIKKIRVRVRNRRTGEGNCQRRIILVGLERRKDLAQPTAKTPKAQTNDVKRLFRTEVSIGAKYFFVVEIG